MGDTPRSRLSRKQLDPANLIISEENLDLIRQVIPSVMEQVQTDRENLEAGGGHSHLRQIAEESEGYLMDLQRWCSRAEDLLEQQAEQMRNQQTRTHLMMSDEDEDFDDEDEDGEEGSDEQGQPGVVATFSRASRGFFDLRLNNNLRRTEGLFDFSTGQFFMFERVIRNTIYGNVIRAQSAARVDGHEVRLTGGQFAIKVYSRELVARRVTRTGQPVQEDPLHELAYQQHLSRPGHSNVLSLMGCFEDETYYYAVLPLAGMELFDVISTHGPFTEVRARMIFREMLEAIMYCNQHGVAHRDISPENFLMDLQTTSHPILIDFGLAYFMQRQTQVATDLGRRASPWAPIPHTGFVGKLLYAAPEMWSNQPYSGASVDLWSAVVTLFVMLFQAPPWERARVSRKRDGYVSIVLNGNLRAVLRQWNFHASDSLQDLLQQVFRENPDERLSLEGVMGHPWMQEG